MSGVILFDKIKNQDRFLINLYKTSYITLQVWILTGQRYSLDLLRYDKDMDNYHYIDDREYVGTVHYIVLNINL
ncbi:MAG: hypothetical protein P857_37 [Candidatus Xenolissoclinum pacificiensis L6]|uniref:Uncharacterized protein n=1 Tax=Candidatus Xenolissoclinum pacificiensis L6 TaxID=1401685 RepID=W2V022_9RICK|nr:MAG: hypothetical protein P857_37 [Candidatus Xenolissoclinum pacificiensis L6]